MLKILRVLDEFQNLWNSNEKEEYLAKNIKNIQENLKFNSEKNEIYFLWDNPEERKILLLEKIIFDKRENYTYLIKAYYNLKNCEVSFKTDMNGVKALKFKFYNQTEDEIIKWAKYHLDLVIFFIKNIFLIKLILF